MEREVGVSDQHMNGVRALREARKLRNSHCGNGRERTHLNHMKGLPGSGGPAGMETKSAYRERAGSE